MTINYTVLNCNITILNNSDTYAASTQTTASLFRYEDTKTINVLKRITTSENTLTTTVVDHDNSVSSYQTTYSPGLDGYFNIYHIIIPTLSWLLDLITKQVNSDTHAMLSLYTNGIYYLNNDKIYKYVYNSSDFSSINTAESLVLTSSLEITIDTLTSLNIDSTYSFLKGSENLFFICNLKSCYLNYCNLIFNLKLIECDCAENKLNIFNRDLIWMTINVIIYLIEDNNYELAEIYLEKIQGCNGICSNIDCSSINQTSCGCN